MLSDTSTTPSSISADVESTSTSWPTKVAADAKPVHVTLDRITPSPLHDKTNRWIIFSDLHVKGSSIETCEAVLDKVHEAAVQRDAGIIFLGDFWHVRGALSVELLNRSVLSFSLHHRLTRGYLDI